MRNILILLAISCFPVLLNGQAIFNHRYHFNTPAAILTSIVATDSCYYATGIYADTLPHLQVGSLFVRLNLDGEPVLVKKLIHPDKSYETRTHTLTALEDGTFVVTGLSYDPVMKGMLIKYGPDGDTVWMKEYLNPFYPAQEFMHPLAMAKGPDGGFVLACWIEKGFGEPDIYLIKTDSLGNIVWTEVYGNSIWDKPDAVLTTAAGDIVVGGLHSNLNTVVEDYLFQAHIFQTDSLGEVIWDYYSSSENLRDSANDMELMNDGSLVVASGVGHEIEQSTVNTVWFDKYIFKLNPQQEIGWELTFEDSELNGNSTTTTLVQMSDGSGFVMAGSELEPEPAPGVDFTIRGWLGKISPDGDSIWVRQYAYLSETTDRHQIYDMKETPDGGLIICGESFDWSGTDSIPQQAWLLKLDEHGCLVPGCHLTDAVEENGQPETGLAIYPNPTSDYLNFQLRGGHVGQRAGFRIVDLQGRLLRKFDSGTPGATHIVPVWDWAAGVYFLQYVEEGTVVVSERFVVQ